MHRLLLTVHRLLLTVAVLSLLAAPGVGFAQPPWPQSTLEPEIGLRREAKPVAGAPRRITPREASGSAVEARERSGAARGAPSPWTAFASLAVIVGVLLAAARLWRKHGPAISGGLPAEALEVLGKRQLDRRHAIQMVRCGSRILVLGVTEEGLRTLAEISEPAEVDHLTGLCRRTDVDPEIGPGVFGLLRHSPEAGTDAEEPAFRGRVDEVLAERFPQAGLSGSTPGRAAHA